ncbi:hypothetical protein [Streptomyces gobiensis]|uniref:hypothetical protein n=1 Tax=Streptomyces gobiensis TaxID=2875706 RepID=UPI001E5D7CD6|nr:hypothetical protein [Streptomyces gobiensis]UGY93475.1 hypothetical protein test1122_18265 [Streptomyces gobiensis]
MAKRQAKGGGRRARTVGACVVLLGLVGYLVVHYKSTEHGPPRCVVRGVDGEQPYEIEPQMARNAATIQAVAASRGLPERAVTIALATALQESALRNIDYGDRDSVGLFQQRPSQGWGSAEQILDPVYSAGKFYDHLVEIPGYTRLPLTVAAQKVQLSGFPQAYAKHEPRAAQLTAALTGRRAATLNCTGSGEPRPGDTARVRQKLTREFGEDVLPTDSGTSAGRSAPSGVISIPVRATARSADNAKAGPAGTSRRGWELAHWALANASELGIERISYGKLVWDARNSADGWRKNDSSASTEVRLTLAR